MYIDEDSLDNSEEEDEKKSFKSNKLDITHLKSVQYDLEIQMVNNK